MLKSWYFKSDKPEINALKVWQDSCCYLYLPKLLNHDVFERAITEGLKTKDYFGYASAKEDDKYLGFVFGGSSLVHLDDRAVLIEKETAKAYLESISPIIPITPPIEPVSGGIDPILPKPPLPQPPVVKAVKTQFHASIDLDPVKAKMDFADIVDEVIQHFTSKLGVKVKISVEIEANAGQGFDETTQRIVKENCNSLKFNHSEFEGQD